MSIIDDKYQEINQKEGGLYIHVPFCRKKCIYCDFYSGGGKSVDWERFTDSLLRELRIRRKELPARLDTLYIGGGTPSMMPDESLIKLVEGIKAITRKRGDWREFTIEVNPEDVTEERCHIWKACGINRVSMGVQTLNDGELRKIGRNHDSQMAINAMEILRRNFDNYTVDVIFGLPGQTLMSWRETLDGIMRHRPDHISAYSLMFEEGTAMTLLRNQGRLTFPTEEECVEMWKVLQNDIRKKGYKQYELSNYSLPGKESVHNRRYWEGNPYLGLGPSAHSFDGNRIRRANRNNIKEYIDLFKEEDNEESGVKNFYMEEILSEEELAEEMIMLSMRMRKGLNIERYGTRFGKVAKERLIKNASLLLKRGDIDIADGSLRLQDRSMMVSDDIILQLCM